MLHACGGLECGVLCLVKYVIADENVRLVVGCMVSGVMVMIVDGGVC